MLHFVVKFYDTSLCLFAVRDYYFIIGSYAYWDARALWGQLAMYVSKHFICQCLLNIKVMERHTMNFT